MASNTYTEEEFKQVLKNLFAEKKRVKELQKQLEEKGIQKKFQAKLADIHKLSLTEEYAKLKSAYLEKEKESDFFKKQFEKVRPALKKLLEDLKRVQAENTRLKGQPVSQENFKKALEDAKQRIQALEEQNRYLETEKERLTREEQKTVALQAQVLQLREELETLRTKNAGLEEEKFEFMRTKADEQKEASRVEQERNRLVEKLAETLSQMQRQSEMIKELREEIIGFHKKVEEYESQEKRMQLELEQVKSEHAKISLEAAHLHKIVEFQLTSVSAEKEALEMKVTQLEQAAQAFQESDGQVLKREYEEKLAQEEATREEILERSYVKMRELSERHGSIVQERELLQQKLDEQGKQLARFEKEYATFYSALKNAKLQCEERDAEIRKAQQHLAKKVKEATVLRDLIEQQNVQFIELQTRCDEQKNEIERLQNNLNLQRTHEEQLHTMAKERAHAAESLTKEWQEKYLALQEDWQEKKGQLIELQKMRKTYDQMTSAFSNLKNILGNPLESPTTEDPQNPGN